MSVLIKNMEMPKNCGECQFCHTENFKQWCCPTGREDIFYDAMPEWCLLEKPKTGEWVRNRTYIGLIFCSECGMPYEEILTPKDFCPSCGADMRGGEEE